MIRDIIDYYKYKRVLRSVYDDTRIRFIQALNASFGVQFQRDKRHERLYAVINPYVQNMSGANEGNNVIYDGNNKPMVEKWVMDNFVIIDKIIHAHELFDLVSVDIQQVDDDLNYLVILQNAMTADYKKSRKRLFACGFGTLFLILILLAIFA